MPAAATSAFDRHEPGFHVLHQVAPGLYTYVTEFLFAGQHPIQNRSLIVAVPGERPGGALAIINPAELRPEVEAAIHALEDRTGARVEHLISPGDWHYLFIDQHVRAFPAARAYVPPGRIPARKPAFPYTLIDVEADEPFPALAPALQTIVVRGLSDLVDPTGQRVRHELVCYVPAAGAITSGDVFYYFGQDELSAGQRAIGQRPRVLDFHFAKWRMVADATALRASLHRILAWDFDRYVCIHGDPGNMLEHGAHADIAKILAWAEAPPA